jgi:hypothetical protein
MEFQKYSSGYTCTYGTKNSRGIPTYYGRKDIAAFLAKLHILTTVEKKYTSFS